MDERYSSGLRQEGQLMLLDKIAKLSQQLEKFNLAGYLEQLNNPRRYLMVNFVGGIARGLGIALGMTILGALFFTYCRNWSF